MINKKLLIYVIMTNILLSITGLSAIVCGVYVITSTPVISVLFLIAVFISIALWLLLHGTTYLALAYIIIYVGAIAILFLFVIIILNIKASDLVYTTKEFKNNLPLGTLLVLAFAIIIIKQDIYYDVSDLKIVYNTDMYSSPYIFSVLPVDATLNNIIQIESIGVLLYTNYIVWLIAAGFIFMLAMVGPIVLCL